LPIGIATGKVTPLTNSLPDREKPRILSVICGCEGGAYHPVFVLSRILHRVYKSVAIVCDSATVADVAESGIPAHPLPAHCSASSYYLPQLNQLLTNNRSITENTPNPLQLWAEKAAATLLDDTTFRSPDIILSSLFGQPLADTLASRFGVPWIFVNPAFSYMDQSYCDWSLDFSPTGAQMFRHWLVPFTEKADVLIHATDPIFDRAQTAIKEHEIYAGPLFYEQNVPAAGPPFPLHHYGPHILTAISTSPQPEDRQLLESIIEAGKAINHPMILTTREAGNCNRQIPPQIMVTGYQPHSTLLQDCRYIICHGGHGTVMKAIVAGVPLIIIPWGRDQPGNARRAEKLGVAVVIPKKECNTKTLVAAANTMEKDPSYRQQVRKHARRLEGSQTFDNAYRKLRSYLGALPDR
jgi:hypothetical protein